LLVLVFLRDLKWRHRYVKVAWKWRLPSETRVRADQQNGDCPSGQQESGGSKLREDVSCPAQAGYGNAPFGRNSDRHVKDPFRSA
jgi:hypothetical protein